MDIPCFRQEDMEAQCPGARPERGFCFDAAQGAAAARSGAVEVVFVSLLPDNTGSQLGQQGKAFSHWFGWGHSLDCSPFLFLMYLTEVQSSVSTPLLSAKRNSESLAYGDIS